VGPGVEVRWNSHSLGAFSEHLVPIGVSLEQANGLVRLPNWSRKRDERDPRPGRVRRWVLAGIHKQKVRLILLPIRPQAPNDPGAVEVITLFFETSPR
jgi:hypothetical protein